MVLTALLLCATVLPMLRVSHWSVRGFDFPRIQLASLAIVLLIVQLIYLDVGQPTHFVMFVITALCLAWQLWWVLPYTRLWPTEVKNATENSPAQSISILTANVLTPNRDAHKLIALVHKYQPDILVTLESDKWWEDQLQPLEALLPETIKCPLDNLYGMHVYSKCPLHDAQVAFLIEQGVPSMHALVELPTKQKIRMHFLHPAPPSPTENTRSEERDAELIIVAKSIADSNQPIIVTGDLNDVAWSRTTRLFRKISGLLDPRVGRGMFNTFHVKFPMLRWPLDHLFHSEHFTVSHIKRLPSIGSDHFPLFTKLLLTPNKASEQEGLKANSDEQKFATGIAELQQAKKAQVPIPEGENE